MTTEYYFIIALVIMIVMMAIYIWKVNNINDELRAEVAKNFYDEMVKRHCRVKKTVTFAPEVAVNRIIELDAKNVNFFGFGYDPYNAKTVINALTQWLCDVGLDPKTLIKPVRQNFATYSPAVKEFDYMVKRGTQQPDGKVTPNPMIHLSPSPLWPWEFGNCQLAESTDGMGNLKPVKANSAASCKVDHVQMVLSALLLHDAADGSITPQ